MALEFNLVQKLNQQLAMTPELRQAIKLLQLGKADLKDAIEKELLENPVLEDIKEFSKDAPQSDDKLNFSNEKEQESASNEKQSEKNDWELYKERFSDTRKPSLNKIRDAQNAPSIENTVSQKKIFT